MNELLIAAMFSAVMLIACAASYIMDLIAGDAQLPKFGKQKKPRKVAAKRGAVGRKVHRHTYEYIEIVPQTDPRVKGLRVEHVRRYGK